MKKILILSCRCIICFEYCDNYSMTSGSLCNYYRDKVNYFADETNNNDDNMINNKKTVTSKSQV